MTTPPPGEQPWPPPGPAPEQPTGQPPYGEPGPAAPVGWGAPVDEPGSPLSQRATFVLLAAAAGVLLGVVGGYLWSVIADPPAGILTKQGVFLTDELAYNQQVEVTLWYLAIGTGLGLLGGLFCGFLGRRHGVAVVVAALVMTVIGAAVSGYLGIHVFGPDPAAEVKASAIGDSITAALDVATFVAYLGWPIGGVVGVLLSVSTWRQPKSTQPPWPSTRVAPQ